MTEIFDGLQNLVSGLGTTRDKATYTEFNRTHLSDDYLGTLYRHWIFAKTVDIPVDDMLSKGRTVQAADVAKEEIENFYRAEQDLNVTQALSDALKWARLYGGGGILLDVNDPGGDLSTPLNPNTLKQGCINKLIPLDRTDITPYHGTDNAIGAMRDPIYYELSDGTKLHPSRFVRFDGVRLPWRELERNNYWGGSIVERVYDEATASKTVLSSIASMVFESNIDVVSVKGLFSKFLTGVGRSKLIERFTLANLTKSINKTLLIDAEAEEFSRQPLNFSGLPPLVSEFLNVVAAAADIPITRFLGQSAKGLNATGEGDLRNYYDMISALQVSMLAPKLRQLDAILTRHVFGYMPDEWRSEFNPLWIMSDLDRANKDKIDADTDTIYDNLGIVQPHQIAGRLLASGRYDMLDAEYVEDMKKVDEMEPIDATETEAENQAGEGETDNDSELLPGASKSGSDTVETDRP